MHEPEECFVHIGHFSRREEAGGLRRKPQGINAAADLTPEAAWEAIDAARDGDTVELPAGTADWSKGWNTGRGAKMKVVTIRGAGMGKTIIRDHRSQRGSNVPFELQRLAGKPFRITGMTFDGTGWPDADLW